MIRYASREIPSEVEASFVNMIVITRDDCTPKPVIFGIQSFIYVSCPDRIRDNGLYRKRSLKVQLCIFNILWSYWSYFDYYTVWYDVKVTSNFALEVVCLKCMQFNYHLCGIKHRNKFLDVVSKFLISHCVFLCNNELIFYVLTLAGPLGWSLKHVPFRLGFWTPTSGPNQCMYWKSCLKPSLIKSPVDKLVQQVRHIKFQWSHWLGHNALNFWQNL